MTICSTVWQTQGNTLITIISSPIEHCSAQCPIGVMSTVDNCTCHDLFPMPKFKARAESRLVCPTWEAKSTDLEVGVVHLNCNHYLTKCFSCQTLTPCHDYIINLSYDIMLTWPPPFLLTSILAAVFTWRMSLWRQCFPIIRLGPRNSAIIILFSPPPPTCTSLKKN